MTAAEFFANKTTLPTPLRTGELERLPLDVRERAFFMAQVTRGEIVELFQAVTAEALAGNLSVEEARRILREKLAALGYIPRPDKAGGLEDLSSVRRQTVVLETNMAMARNYAAEAKQTAAARAFPVKLLVRQQRRMVPRDWVKRWADAMENLTEEEKSGVSIDPPMARIGHPIWRLISRFDAPYAPFDFNSGMGTLPKGRKAAQEAGIYLGQYRSMPFPPQLPTFNEGLKASPAITDPTIRKAVAQSMPGKVEWIGDELVYKTERRRKLIELAKANPTLTPEEIAKLYLQQEREGQGS